MERVCALLLLSTAAHAYWWADYWEDRKQARWDTMEGKSSTVCDYAEAQRMLDEARWDKQNNNKWNPFYKSNLNHQIDVLEKRVEHELQVRDAREAAQRQAEEEAKRERERKAAEDERKLLQAARAGALVGDGKEEGEHTPGYTEAPNETVPEGGKDQLRREVDQMRANAKDSVERTRRVLADHAWGFATASGVGNGIGGAMALIGPWGTVAGTLGAIAGDLLLIGVWCKHCNDMYTDACDFQKIQDDFLISEVFQTAVKYEYIEAGIKPLLKVGWHQLTTRTNMGIRLAENVTSLWTRLKDVTLATLNGIYQRMLERLMPNYAARRLAQAQSANGAAVTTQRVFNWVPIVGAIVGAALGFAFMRHTCGTVNVEFRDKYLQDIDAYYDSLLVSLAL